jgi:uncharacterized integral membrane protein (TIGR00698 family)
VSTPVQPDASEYLLGLGLLFALAVLVRVVGRTIPQVTPLVLAIVAGALLVNGPGVPRRARPGIGTHDLWLKTGIVLLGASLPLGTLLERGPAILLLVAVVVLCSLATVEVVASRVLAIDRPLRSLIAAGASICGVSAVVGVGGSVDADENDIAYAAGTILLFDAITIVTFPWLGHLLALPDRVFGIWAGLSMFSTGPAVAAGMAFAPEAGQWATLTKLTRNALLGVVIVGYSVLDARSDQRRSSGDTHRSIRGMAQTLLANLPAFLVGFLVVSVLASSGFLAAETVRSLERATGWLFTIAFVGLGAELDLDAIRGVGLRPVIVTATALLAAAVVSLALIGAILGP